MIKILYDHQIFSEQNYGGISRYFANLCQELNKGNEAQVKIAVRYSTNHYLQFYPQLFDFPFGRWLLRKNAKRYRWNKKYSQRLLAAGNYDVFHATYYDTNSLHFNRKPMVITIHDMIHENHPYMFPNSGLIIAEKKQMMEAANAIIAISQATRYDILQFYPFLEHKITVVYHGLPASPFQNKQARLIQNNYLLFVGERGHYKNFNRMVKGIQSLLAENQEMRLICVGGKSLSQEESNLLKGLNIANQCIQMVANEKELANLYQHAEVFIYPSLEEGFGLPLLEAFQYDCPVACSNQSCLPEIGGDAVAYFDPHDEKSILTAVSMIINNDGFAKELIQKGRERASLFTMKQSVTETLAVYKSLLNPS